MMRSRVRSSLHCLRRLALKIAVLRCSCFLPQHKLARIVYLPERPHTCIWALVELRLLLLDNGQAFLQQIKNTLARDLRSLAVNAEEWQWIIAARHKATKAHLHPASSDARKTRRVSGGGNNFSAVSPIDSPGLE